MICVAVTRKKQPQMTPGLIDEGFDWLTRPVLKRRQDFDVLIQDLHIFEEPKMLKASLPLLNLFYAPFLPFLNLVDLVSS